ncbi:hypothetical protein K1719_008996 [Acacia pycnantha]|nr:hypothetical protein K1719_008996 [Acacia pycnantha]
MASRKVPGPLKKTPSSSTTFRFMALAIGASSPKMLVLKDVARVADFHGLITSGLTSREEGSPSKKKKSLSSSTA